MPPYLTPLSHEDLAALGLPPEWRFAMADRVRFHELDALNHVNNAVFFSWFETVRAAYVRAYGVSQYTPADPRLVIRETSCRFLQEMLLDEPYILAARTTRFRRTSFTMEFAVFAETLRATGQAVVVALEPDGSGRFPLPEAAKAAFAERDGAIDDSAQSAPAMP